MTKATVTAGGKGIEIVQDKVNPHLYRVNFTSGGKLPKTLSGRFTKTDLAQKAIDAYVQRGYTGE